MKRSQLLFFCRNGYQSVPCSFQTSFQPRSFPLSPSASFLPFSSFSRWSGDAKTDGIFFPSPSLSKSSFPQAAQSFRPTNMSPPPWKKNSRTFPLPFFLLRLSVKVPPFRLFSFFFLFTHTEKLMPFFFLPMAFSCFLGSVWANGPLLLPLSSRGKQELHCFFSLSDLWSTPFFQVGRGKFSFCVV